jgi:hypothetical protein
MIGARLTLRGHRGTRQVTLADYLDAAAEESAHEASYSWIKELRRLQVDGAPFRERFTARGDSLWWFTELYFHKQRVILDIHRTISAINVLLDSERPAAIAAISGPAVVRHVASAVAAARSVPCAGGVSSLTWLTGLARLDARARLLTLSALARADRWKRGEPAHAPVPVAAFIHRAFWRSGTEDGSAESYIGPILAALEQRLGAASIRYVGVGPATNFRARRRWVPASGATASVTPIERFAGWAALAESRAVWKRRFADFRTLTRAASIRSAARIQGVDCWPLIREQLAGIAWLQWPWSVRAMDEAAAALDALQPRTVLTYAEAGGWGRALLLESRRRGIPSAGLQHGFIYRHWLNYRHEPDEMQAGRTRRFPYPTKTLVFDQYAARHLAEQGRYPLTSLAVTGSPRLDELASQMTALPPDGIAQIRQELNIGPSEMIALVTTKEKEARASLAALVDAAASLPGAVLVIKPHPAETADAYSNLPTGPHLRVVAADTSLARLLAAARAVVTVNSTVALDAAALDIPSLAIGLPNNLSPFVESGAIAGAQDPSDLPGLLRRILYDDEFRQQLAERRRAVFGRPVMVRERRAAERSTDVVLELIQQGRTSAAEAD